jgi:hypothetical protein
MTYACLTWELAADACKTRFFAPSEIFQGAQWSAVCTWLSIFHMYTIIKQNCAGNKKKSYKIMRMNMFTV